MLSSGAPQSIFCIMRFINFVLFRQKPSPTGGVLESTFPLFQIWSFMCALHVFYRINWSPLSNQSLFDIAWLKPWQDEIYVKRSTTSDYNWSIKTAGKPSVLWSDRYKASPYKEKGFVVKHSSKAFCREYLSRSDFPKPLIFHFRPRVLLLHCRWWKPQTTASKGYIPVTKKR